jgi:hypothetical protein
MTTRNHLKTKKSKQFSKTISKRGGRLTRHRRTKKLGGKRTTRRRRLNTKRKRGGGPKGKQPYPAYYNSGSDSDTDDSTNTTGAVVTKNQKEIDNTEKNKIEQTRPLEIEEYNEWYKYKNGKGMITQEPYVLYLNEIRNKNREVQREVLGPYPGEPSSKGGKRRTKKNKKN